MGLASDAVLERLTRLHPKIIDLTLDRVLRLLERVGSPERKLAPAIHVAGTNGKGSVMAYLRAMAETAGKRVQVYSSPHLVRFHERIRLVDGLISEPTLLDLLEYCEEANGEEQITFFEITSVAAFLAFAREPADLLLLEVGLGGRLDATNVLDKPRLSIVTPVSMDHMQYLGNSIEEIAYEKAGILKPGVTCVVAPQLPAAHAVIVERAKEVGAPLFSCGEDWQYRVEGSCLIYSGKDGERRYSGPILLGLHQFENAAVALAAAEELQEFGLDAAVCEKGLQRAVWPARMQRLTKGPLAGRLPKGWELWLDGGHNASAGEALARSLAAWRDRPLDLIYGMMNTKASEDFLRPFAGLVRHVAAVAVPGEINSHTAEDSAAHARAVGLDARPMESVSAALNHLTSQPGPARVLICGSLYLAGRVLAQNG